MFISSVHVEAKCSPLAQSINWSGELVASALGRRVSLGLVFVCRHFFILYFSSNGLSDISPVTDG